MAENTKIEWARHTFNPWVGCTKLAHPKGSACDFCYAAAWAKRTGHPELWEGERRRTTPANWRTPIKWNAAAAALGEHHTVFCASLADVFDNQAEPQWRADLFDLIRATPNLIWLLLTKRPENIVKMVEAAGGLPANVALGTTIEDQERANHRGPLLLKARDLLHPMFTFFSCEPMIGPIDLYNGDPDPRLGGVKAKHTLIGSWWECDGPKGAPSRRGVDWVIAGGESGGKARPSHPDWFRSLRDQCDAAEVDYLFKQWGEWAPHTVLPGGDLGGDVRRGRVRIMHPSGRSDVEVSEATKGHSTERGSRYMARVGKKAAGRLLDAREHNEMPRRA